MLFLACQTQWRHAGMAGMRIGLDYPACEIVANSQGKTLRRGELLGDLRVIEAAAIDTLAKAAEARAAKEAGK